MLMRHRPPPACLSNSFLFREMVRSEGPLPTCSATVRRQPALGGGGKQRRSIADWPMMSTPRPIDYRVLRHGLVERRAAPCFGPRDAPRSDKAGLDHGCLALMSRDAHKPKWNGCTAPRWRCTTIFCPRNCIISIDQRRCHPGRAPEHHRRTADRTRLPRDASWPPTPLAGREVDQELNRSRAAVCRAAGTLCPPCLALCPGSGEQASWRRGRHAPARQQVSRKGRRASRPLRPACLLLVPPHQLESVVHARWIEPLNKVSSRNLCMGGGSGDGCGAARCGGLHTC